MRRIVILVATGWIGLSSWAMAAPFDQLSNRLKEYDDQSAAAPDRPQRRNQAASYQEKLPAEDNDAGTVWDEPCGGDALCGWQDSVPSGFWGRAEVLYWWIRGSNTPPLVTTDSATATTPGALPGATVLFGGDRINRQGQAGGRFTLGYWFDECETVGVEGSFLFVGNVGDSFHASSFGSPVLARPFFNVQTGQQDAIPIAFTNLPGSVAVNTGRQALGSDVNLRRPLYCDPCRRVDMLAGYRFFHFSEGLGVATSSTLTDPGTGLPVQLAVHDTFGTRNQFNGGQLGINAQFNNGPWTLDVLGKVALGGVWQRVMINGTTISTVQGSPPTLVPGGGLLAVAGTNIGTFNRTQFSALPEIDVNLRYQLTPLWRLNVGYSLLGLTHVVRPGDQIDTRLNQFPTRLGTFPMFAFHNSDVWMQGINLGIECNF
jgi:hypothetical protein